MQLHSSRQQRIAAHRGGPLSKSDHILLMQRAIACIEHSISLIDDEIDHSLTTTLVVAQGWCEGTHSVGDARTAAFHCHAIARASNKMYEQSIARALGHTVATAHMADHAPKAVEYALIALAYHSHSLDQIDHERERQNSQLPQSISQLVIDTRNQRHNFWEKQIQKALSHK